MEMGRSQSDDHANDQQNSDFRSPIHAEGGRSNIAGRKLSVVTDEELIEELSFPVYRRVSTMIFVPADSASTGGQGRRKSSPPLGRARSSSADTIIEKRCSSGLRQCKSSAVVQICSFVQTKQLGGWATTCEALVQVGS
jgi:hypothetical protein